MNYQFKKMSQKQAENIAFSWHYEGDYSFYDIAADKEDLAEFLDREERGDNYFIVEKNNDEIGFFCFENENDTVDIGLGMKPGFTGKGNGLAFVEAGLSFAISEYNPEKITLSVAIFNKRAIKVYMEAGFEPNETFMQKTNGGRFEFLKMTYLSLR